VNFQRAASPRVYVTSRVVQLGRNIAVASITWRGRCTIHTTPDFYKVESCNDI
jgi:acyl-coenzyme A thioesterase PaaI-like protein